MSQIKKYTGTDMNEIIERIKAEWGREAVIFQSSSRKKLFNGQKEFEVIAGLGEIPPKMAERNNPAGNFQKGSLEIQNLLSSIKSNLKPPLQNTEKIREIKNPLASEINELRMLLNSIFPKTGFLDLESVRKVRSHLLNNGAEREITETILNSINVLLGQRMQGITTEQYIKVATAYIEKKFKPFSFSKERDEKRIKIFTGPTGSGKTTTLAKLAATALLKDKKDTVLVSLDSYRIGAHAQLKAYGEILSVPFFTASSPDDLKRIIETLPKTTNIFIDTSGLNPLDCIGIGKMTPLFSELPEKCVYLVVSGGNPVFQLKTIFSKFEITGYNSVIITKIDELTSFGHLLSLLNLKIKGIDYLTNGQEVLDDIMIFSPGYLASKILTVE